MRSKTLIISMLATAAAIAVFPAASKAQHIYYYVLQGGRPTFADTVPVENGYVNLANGDLHLEFPLASPRQRGALAASARLVYDARIWWLTSNGTSDVWEPTDPDNPQNVAAGWSLYPTGYPEISNTEVYVGTCSGGYVYYYGPFTSVDGHGTTRVYPISTRQNAGCQDTDSSSGSAYDENSTGTFMTISNFTSASVLGPSGSSFTNLSGAPAVAKDSNGNYFSSDSSHNLVDTLGRVPASVTKGTSSYTITAPNAEGSLSTYTVNLETINVSTDFGAPGVTEYSGTLEVVSSIAFPDGTSYSFTYDSGTTPGHYGELTGMTLRTGGQVTYTWTKYNDDGAFPVEWISSRTAAGGTWTYTPEVLSSCAGNVVPCQQQVTEIKPSGDKSVYTFTTNDGDWNTETDDDSSSGALMKKTVTAYDFSNNCPEDKTYGWVGACYIRPTQEDTDLPGAGTSQTAYSYDSIYYGNITAMKQWNYTASGFGATPDRETDYTYLSSAPYIAANILNRVTDKVTYQDGVKDAETQLGYDSTPLAAVTGIVNHDDTNYGTGNTVRGNPTAISQWVGGSNYLTTTNYYDTTGQVVKTVDPAGNNTLYSYADNFYNDSGSNPPAAYTPSAPTNAYLTEATLPLSGTLKYGYYYGTGEQALSTDQNGNTSYTHYQDSLDRQTQTDDPAGGWSLTTYTGANEMDNYSAVYNSSPSASCTSCVHTETVLDDWGRVESNILASDPGGATTVATTYDTSSRVASKSNPYRSTSDPTYGLETYAYDGLNRQLTDTHADGNVAYTYYGAGVAAAGGLSSQACPVAGFPVLTIDAAGHKQQTWTGVFGNPVEVDQEAANGSLTLATCYQYNALNDLTEVTQGGQARTYAYDGLGRKTSETTPEAGTVNYYFTTGSGGLCAGGTGKVCRRTDARGITTTYSYDAENRLTSKTYSDSTPAAYYYYDESSVTVNGQNYTLANGKGRLTHTSADGGLAITVTDYNPVGNIDDFWQCTPFNCPSGKLWDEHYEYYPGGNVETEVRAEGYYVSYGVGNDGRTNAINNGLSGPNYPEQLAVIYYAPQGAVSEIENPCAGTGCTENVERYDYNNRLQLVRSRLGSGSNGTSIGCAVYNYYGNEANPTACSIPAQGTGDDGNVLGKYDQDNANASLSHTTSLAYDPTHRLTGSVATGNSTFNLAFAYDQFGNMTCQQNSQTQGLCPQYSFSSSTNQITNSGYTYDASGDLTSDGTYNYQYDAEGRLASVNRGWEASYVYNALGERVEKEVGGTYGTYTEYAFDKDGEPEAENNRGSSNGGWVDSWVNFEGQHLAHYENNGVYYIYSNQVGTAGVVTDWTGAVVQDELHYPWGQVCVSPECPSVQGPEERFASLHHRDAATNLDPTHFRMYSSDEARWLTPDPAQADIYNPQSMSRYGYAAGNPSNFLDPSGLGGCDSWWASQQSWCSGDYDYSGGACQLDVMYGSCHKAPSETSSYGPPSEGAIGNGGVEGGGSSGFSPAVDAGIDIGGEVLCAIAEPCGIGVNLGILGAVIASRVYLYYSEQTQLKNAAKAAGLANWRELGCAVEVYKKENGYPNDAQLTYGELVELARQVKAGNYPECKEG